MKPSYIVFKTQNLEGIMVINNNLSINNNIIWLECHILLFEYFEIVLYLFFKKKKIKFLDRDEKSHH